MQPTPPHTPAPTTRRQIFRTAGALAAGFALSPLAARLARAAGPDAAGGATKAKKKVLFFTKSSGFQHSVITRPKDDPDKLAYAEQILTDLGAAHGFDVTCTKDGTIFAPEKIKAFDAFVFYTTGDLTTPGTDKTPPMSKEGKQQFLDAIHDGGKGFIALHSGADTFHSPSHKKGQMFRTAEKPELDPYIQMLGGEFIVHGAQQKSTMHVVDLKFPGADGLKDFEMLEEWYSLKNFSPDLHVVLVQETAGMKGDMYERKPYPATWARMHGKGRVFYSSMGHREDVWKRDEFVRVLVGAMNWVTGNVDADVTPNLAKVAPDAELPLKAGAAS